MASDKTYGMFCVAFDEPGCRIFIAEDEGPRGMFFLRNRTAASVVLD